MQGLTDREIMIAVWSELRAYNREFVGLVTKTVVGLVAVAGATVGVRFIGSPVHVVLGGYITIACGTFILLSLLLVGRRLPWYQRLLRTLFGLFMLFVGIARSYFFEQGAEPAPWWYGPGIDSFLIMLAVLLIIGVWRDWPHV